jgi:hypothetical protein
MKEEGKEVLSYGVLDVSMGLDIMGIRSVHRYCT